MAGSIKMHKKNPYPPPSGDASGTLRGKRSHTRKALHQSPTAPVHRKRGGNLILRVRGKEWGKNNMQIHK